MCKISYEKCICLIFLIVILVILICSGFPIDNVAMPDNSKKYFRTSSNNSTRSANFLSRVFNVKSTQNNETFPSHRLRHLRQLRAQTRDLRTQRTPMGHIEATVFQNDATASELYAQVPSSLTKTINTRWQRSSSHSRHRSRQDCLPEHFSVKAYKSQIVLRAKVQGIERTNYTVSFKLIGQLKNPSSFPVHECLTLQFSTHTGNCEKGRRGRKNLVKADIKASQEYILFLNASVANKCTPSYSPEWVPTRRRKQDNMLRILNKVCNPKFKVKPTSIAKLEDISSWRRSKDKKKRRLKLICRAAGLPFPRISWRRNNVTIVNSTDVRISYVKRRSTLVIREPTQDDFGRYECVARGVDGIPVSKIVEVYGPPAATQIPFSESVSSSVEVHGPRAPTQIPFSEPVSTKRECNETYTEAFCMGHGKCFTDYNDQVYCECKDGYIGQRCEEKTPPHPASRYPQTPSYTCKLGLSTKYYCY